MYGLIQSLKMPTQAAFFSEKIGFPLLLTCIANVAWVFSWHYEVLPLYLVCMLALLGTLGAIYTRLVPIRGGMSAWEKYLVHLPMSLYFGWISIATIANTTTLLVAYKWSRFGLGEEFWTVLVMGIGTLLALVMLFGRRDPFYTLVVDWAISGILLQRTADKRIQAQGAVLAAGVFLALITLCVIVQLARGRVY